MKKKGIKKQDLKKKTEAELKKILEEEEKSWLRLKMELKINKLKDVHLARKKRKQIARIKTILHLRRLK